MMPGGSAADAPLRVSDWLRSHCEIGRLAVRLPEDLRAAKRFTLWRATVRVTADGPKVDKVPVQVNGRNAKTDDASTWSDFSTAAGEFVARARFPEDHPAALHGVSLQMLDGAVGQPMTPRAERLWGVDLDKVLDEYSTSPLALEILEAAGACYAEVSPSGRGLRIIGRGGAPEDLRDFNRAPVEFYMGDGGRHLTLTGNVYEGKKTFGPMSPVLAAKLLDLAGAKKTKANGVHAHVAPGRIDPIEPSRLEWLLSWVDPNCENPDWHRYLHAIAASTDHDRALDLAERWSRGELAALSREDRAELDKLFPWERSRSAPPRWDAAAPDHLARILAASTTERTGRVAGGGSIVMAARAAGCPDRREDAESPFAADGASTQPKDAATAEAEDERAAGPDSAPEHDEPAGQAEHQEAAPAGPTATARPLTDAGNAERFVTRYGHRVRYVHGWGRWLLWDESRWANDERGEVRELAIETARRLLADAANEPDAKARERTVKHALSAERRDRIMAAVDLASSMAPVAAVPDDLDRDLDVLNVPNGEVDLRTGRLERHEPAHLATKLAPVAYDPAADAPTWRAVLERVLPDPEVRAYVQRAAGYSLTGSVAEQCLFFCYGTGANGKSTFLETLREVLGEGEYAKTAQPDLLLAKKQERHAVELADLRGMRLVSTIEAGEGRAWDEVRVKWLTGGDTISARLMYGNPFSFTPTHKFWIAANHKPRVAGRDLGFWRRVHLVPWTVTIPEAERDPDLRAKLRAELPGILRWAVEGCLEWRRGGLRPPKAVLDATGAYRSAEDVLGAFLDEECMGKADGKVDQPALFSEYRQWAERTGERPMSARAFGAAIEERGLERERSNGRTWIRGLVLRARPPSGGAP